MSDTEGPSGAGFSLWGLVQARSTLPQSTPPQAKACATKIGTTLLSDWEMFNARSRPVANKSPAMQAPGARKQRQCIRWHENTNSAAPENPPRQELAQSWPQAENTPSR